MPSTDAADFSLRSTLPEPVGNLNEHIRNDYSIPGNEKEMDSSQHVTVPLRYGIKKMRKRRDLDALLNHGQQKMASCGNNNNLRRQAGQGVGRVIYSQDKLLNAGSTDDQDDFHWVCENVFFE